jgi:Uncharacterized protein conserved in bacteria (DUF2252)
MPDWASLQRRIDGDVALPGSPAYRASRPPFNARFRDVRPAAIVACASPRTSPRRSGSPAGTVWSSRPAPAAQLHGPLLDPGRAHRRHPDAVRNRRRRRGHGGRDVFDRAILEFAEAYADQNQRDYQALLDAVKAGTIKAQTGL